VEVSDDASLVTTRQVLRHPGEVLSLTPSPQDRRLLVSCGKQRGQAAEASLWKLPVAEDASPSGDDEDAVATQELGLAAAFPAQKLPVSEYEQCRVKRSLG